MALAVGLLTPLGGLKGEAIRDRGRVEIFLDMTSDEFIFLDMTSLNAIIVSSGTVAVSAFGHSVTEDPV